MVLVNADQDQILRLISKNLETARKSRSPSNDLGWVLDSTNNLWERVMERVVQAFNENQANEKISTISKMSRDRLMRLIRLI